MIAHATRAPRRAPDGSYRTDLLWLSPTFAILAVLFVFPFLYGLIVSLRPAAHD